MDFIYSSLQPDACFSQYKFANSRNLQLMIQRRLDGHGNALDPQPPFSLHEKLKGNSILGFTLVPWTSTKSSHPTRCCCPEKMSPMLYSARGDHNNSKREMLRLECYKLSTISIFAP